MKVLAKCETCIITMRQYFIASLSLLLASMSLLIIKSVAPDLFSKQLLFFCLGFTVFLVLQKIDYIYLQILGQIAFYLIIVLLVFLLVLGQTTRGITAWINLFADFKLQPSQFALPAFLFSFLPWWPKVLAQKKIIWQSWLWLALMWLVPGLLIFIQPDFGGSLIYFLSSGILIFFLPLSKKFYLSSVLLLPIASLIIFVFLLKPNQQERITSFFSGYGQDQQSSYHARQSLIAVGSGKALGRGLGFGVQSHLRFLPERQTDFIFASFAEETGFLGSSFLVLIYFSLINYLLWHAFKAKNLLVSAWLSSSAMMLFIQVVINIGMNIGLMPITGITLPLFSYGGSSITAIFLMLAICQKMINQENWTSAIVIE